MRLIEYIKNNKKTAFLKVVLVVLFIPVVLISCIAGPSLIHEGYISPEVSFGYVLPFGILMILVLFPVAFAILQTWVLLVYIEKDVFFSDKSASRLMNIMYSAIVASVLFAGMLPSIFYFTQLDDAPGLAMLGLIFVGASVAVAVFASMIKDLVLEKKD